MKKTVPVVVCALLSLFLFVGCGGGTELTISIGNGMVENDSVSVRLEYGDAWKNGESIFTVNYGHESDAVLADEYFLSFCDVDPMFEDTVNLHTVFSFKKADLEDRTVSGGSFSGSASEVVVDDLSACLPQGEGVCTVYIVLHSSDTDYSDITTFAAHELTYEWQEDGVKLVRE